jgi:F0F1-type ATP synthase epsilon subunit
MKHQDTSTGEITDIKQAKTNEPTSIDGKPFMHVKVYSPFQTYFDSTAFSISATNVTGPFDILPKHHNFLTLLTAGNLVIQGTEGERQIKISRGVMHVKADKVIVFLDV